MACPYSFLSSRGEKHLDPKSVWDLAPDKLVCAMSCQRDVTDLNFLHASRL